MIRERAEGMSRLVDFIGAGCPDPSLPGPVVMEISIWGDRIVRASYYRGSYEDADIETKEDVVADDDALMPLVEALVERGKNFRVLTGESDQTCFLEWTIAYS